MNQNMEDKLVKMAQELKPGEMREIVIPVVGNYHDGIKTDDAFTASKDGKIVLNGSANIPKIREVKSKRKGFSFVKNFVALMNREMERLGKREDDLDQIYTNQENESYELVDSIPVYFDERGFEYYLKSDLDGNKYAWIKLDDGSTATFLDPDRTILMIGDKAYYFDGTIHWDQEMDYIFPHR